MNEITRQNFESVFKNLIKSIENSSFVAFDTEFTGLPSARENSFSLFDTIEERYKKLRSATPGIIICQIGLSVFTKDVNENRYNVDVYTFYLRPPSFASLDNWFSFQVSAVDFLRTYQFDFNKCFNEGLTYLNEDEQQIVEKDISKKSFIQFFDTNSQRDNLLEACTQVSNWLCNSNDDELLLENYLFEGIDDYVSVNVVREKNPNCWIYRNENKQFIVKRVTANRRKELELQNVANEDRSFFENILGFSRVFKKLVDSKKPIVGHNCLCDLVLMYQQFYKPLPAKYKTFTKELQVLFPCVFDTKHITQSVKREFEDMVSLGSGDLSQLYATLLKSHVSFGLCYSPTILLSGNSNIVVAPHHAGFDSFACGFIFLKLTHLLAIKILKGQPKPMTWAEHLSAVLPFKNRINLIRADDHFLNLEGLSCRTADGNRPKWLHIESNTGTPLDLEQLTAMLSSYGIIDVKLLSKDSALLAVGNWACARAIARAYYKNKSYTVNSYDPLRHCPTVRTAMWSAFTCTFAFSLLLLYKICRM